ncbi:MAG: MFS family permease [Parasphingorhabdus sp.]|jgi:MFS family permease
MLALLKTEWRLLLFGFLLSFWSSPGQTFLISLFSGEIRQALNLSDGEFAGIYSIATLSSAFVIVWSGTLVDRLSLRNVSIMVLVGLVAGCLLLSVSTNLVMLLVSLFLLRQFGQALMTVIGSTSVVRYISNQPGKSAAIASMGYAVAEAVLPALLVALLLVVGWRASWQIMAITVFIVMVPVTVFLLRNHQARHKSYLISLSNNSANTAGPNRQRQWTRAEVMRDKLFYLFLPGLMSQPLMFTGFIFHQVHLVEFKQWQLADWAMLFSLYAVVSVATKVITGFLVDRFGAIRMVPVVGLPMGLGLIVLAVSDSLFGGAVFLVLTGITVGFYSTVITPFWAEMYGSRNLASVKSLGTSIMAFSTGVSPIVIGWQIDLGTSMNHIALVAAGYIVCTSCLAYYAFCCHRAKIMAKQE